MPRYRHISTKMLFVVAIFLLCFLPQISFAQIQETDISMSASPSFPKIGDSVTVKVSSFTVNLDKVFIVWSVNGQERANGVGKKTFSFTIDNDTRTQITASITNTSGNTITKSIFVNSTDIDMLWEATDAYVPPFYRGKALITREGGFKVVAMPSVLSSRGKVKPGNLSYTWKKDGNVQVSSSGFGKNSFSFKNSYLDSSNEIEVEVEDVENKTKTGGKITLTGLEKPEVLFYKKDPALGVMYNQALVDGFTLGDTPETIVALPYYFSVKNTNSLSFNWLAGGERIVPNKNKNEVTLVAPGESGGTTIEVTIENTRSLFQTLTKKINVGF